MVDERRKVLLSNIVRFRKRITARRFRPGSTLASAGDEAYSREEAFEFLKLKAKDAVSARSSMKATLGAATPTPVNDLPNRSFAVVLRSA
jgi:hypothetical protein